MHHTKGELHTVRHGRSMVEGYVSQAEHQIPSRRSHWSSRSPSRLKQIKGASSPETNSSSEMSRDRFKICGRGKTKPVCHLCGYVSRQSSLSTALGSEKGQTLLLHPVIPGAGKNLLGHN